MMKESSGKLSRGFEGHGVLCLEVFRYLLQFLKVFGFVCGECLFRHRMCMILSSSCDVHPV